MTTQPMNQREINEGLKLFKKYLAKITHYHADPLQENCYISSSDIEGIYFPNTTFEQYTHSHYDICAVCKVNEKLGVMFSLHDDESINPKIRHYLHDYIFTSFDELLYNRYMLEIKTKIEKRIAYYQKEIDTLNKVKVITKKDGAEFKNILQNFEGAYIGFDYSVWSHQVSAVKISYDLWLYRHEENREQEITVKEIKDLINEYKTSRENYIKRENLELKRLEKSFNQFEKATKQLRTFKESVSNYHDYEEVIKYMVL